MGSVFHELTAEELDSQLDEARSELRELRFTYAVARSLQNPARVRKLKRDVARILTVKREREMGITEIKEATSKKGKGKSAGKGKAKSAAKASSKDSKKEKKAAKK